MLESINFPKSCRFLSLCSSGPRGRRVVSPNRSEALVYSERSHLLNPSRWTSFRRLGFLAMRAISVILFPFSSVILIRYWEWLVVHKISSRGRVAQSATSSRVFLPKRERTTATWEKRSSDGEGKEGKSRRPARMSEEVDKPKETQENRTLPTNDRSQKWNHSREGCERSEARDAIRSSQEIFCILFLVSWEIETEMDYRKKTPSEMVSPFFVEWPLVSVTEYRKRRDWRSSSHLSRPQLPV